MDLHFTGATPTAEEIAAVDGVAVVASGSKRTYLLPVLHAIQNRVGWISPGALNYASRKLDVPPAEAFGVADFYALLSTRPQPPAVAHVCDDIACKVKGADRLCAEMERTHGPEGSSPDGKTYLASQPLPRPVRARAGCPGAGCRRTALRAGPGVRQAQARLRPRCRANRLHSLSCVLPSRRWASRIDPAAPRGTDQPGEPRRISALLVVLQPCGAPSKWGRPRWFAK